MLHNRQHEVGQAAHQRRGHTARLPFDQVGSGRDLVRHRSCGHLKWSTISIDRPPQIVEHAQPVRPQREVDLTLPPGPTRGIGADHRKTPHPGGGTKGGVQVAAYGIGVAGEQE